MQAKTRFCGLLAAFLTTALVGGSQVSADERADVLRQIEQIRTTLPVPSAEDATRAQSEAVAAAKVLVAYLEQLPTGQIVSKAIKLDDLSSQLQRTPADLPALTALDERLRNDRHSSPAEIALQLALNNYLDYLQAQANPGLADEYRRRLGELAEALEADSQQSTPQSRARLHQAYDRLPHYPGGRPLRLTVRRVISYPNQMLAASTQFLNEEAGRQKVEMTTPINENSSGTTIQGSAKTKGQVAILLHPNDAEAEIEVDFRGKIQSQLTGTKGPVNVFERGNADLLASDVGYLSPASGVRTAPAAAQAKNDIRPYAVRVNLGCKLLRNLVTRIAWKTAWKQKAASDRQADEKIESQIKTELVSRTKGALEQINQMFRSFYPPTATEGSRSPRLHFFTTASHMYGGAEFAAPWQLAAPSPPPTIAAIDHALLIQVHESAIDNNSSYFAGRTMNEPDFREIVFDTLALTPDEPKRQRGHVPVKVILTERKPLEVSLKDGRVGVTFHIDSFYADGRPYAGERTVSVDYLPRIGAHGVEVVRDGAVRVEPASVAGQPELAALMAVALPERATTEGPTSTGSLGASHHLRVTHLSIADGWLNVGWEHDNSAATAAPSTNSTNEVRP